jgi:hypothetical protein
MVRLLTSGILWVFLCLGAGLRPQEPAPGTQPEQQDQFFSGTVTALEETRITVTRTVLGTDSTTRTFLITPKTRMEGKPRVNARVTVRFVTEDEVDRAVHILVRPANKK